MSTQQHAELDHDPDSPALLEAEGRSVRLVWIATWLLWLAFVLPLVLQAKTLYVRDVFYTHLPLKAFGAQQLETDKSAPYFNPSWGLGQPFRGNPNALPLYPGNQLYRFLPFFSAFNLHYALHWLIALLTAHALARRLGMSKGAAALAALTWAGSGVVLTCLSFYNIVVVVAWLPLALCGAARGDARGIGYGALAWGLLVLGGDPVSGLLAATALLMLAIARFGLARGVGLSTAIGALGTLVAVPQVVAAVRTAPFAIRTAVGGGAAASNFALTPARLLEWLAPSPFGRPGIDGAGSGISVPGTFTAS